jgi:hypothetical protein
MWDATGLFELPTPERVTGGNAGFALLKTPTVQLAVNGGSQHPDKRRAGGHGPTLADEVEHLLPTPQSSDWKGSAQTQGRTRNMRGKRHPRGLGDMDLTEAVALLPTPRASQRGNWQNAPAKHGKTLQEVLTGDDTPLRSAPGGRSWDGQLPGQLTLDETASPD